MKTSTLLLAAALAAILSAAAAETEKDRWNLSDLYPSVEAWGADAAKVEAQLKDLAACQGKLGASAKRLLACLDLQSDIGKRLYRMEVYSGEKLSEDTSVPASLELNQRAELLDSRVDEATAFMSPEILALGAGKVKGFIAAEPKLKPYAHLLDDVLRKAPHTLDKPREELIATFGLVDGAGGNVYSTLADADMPWPTVKLSDGTEAKLDQSGYEKYRQAQNRADRKLVFDAFWGKWKEFERTYGVTLYSQLKTGMVRAKVRKYPDSIAARLDRNRLPVKVYDTLVEQTRANLATLHRYFRLRAKMLGVAGEMRYYDIYPPLVKSDIKFPYAQGRRMMVEAVKPLGPEYVAALEKGLDNRWMDLYPRPHKQSGAHMNGAAYDVHPYLLINYNDDYESVSTIAHEWGHAMHSYYSNRTQPFVNANYATFVAEIASTFNEALLLEYALKTAKTDDERLLYLGSALENLRGTFFRQAMFAEFEREIHARVDKGESLTGAGFTKIYGDILRKYHGDAEGVVKIDDAYTVEWAFIPHFYSSFYVYQYATSIAASSEFARQVLAGEPGAHDRYMKLISSGGSDYPYELVKAAGVDLATPAPYQALVARMNRIMDEIEAILAKK